MPHSFHVIEPAHPALERLRSLCLSLPETSEADSWGHPDFRAGKRTFVTFERFKGRPTIQGGERKKALVIMNYRHAAQRSTSACLSLGSGFSRGSLTAAAIGNPDIGFDFRGSPFGKDTFDYFPFFPTLLRYQDVFTGFVFFKPLSAHRCSLGLPDGVFDQPLCAEILKRYRIMGENVTTEKIKKEFGEIRIFNYEDKTIFSQTDCSQKIQKWLKARP